MRVSSAEFLKEYGALSDKALVEPVTITRDGQDQLVLMSAAKFERIRRYLPRSRLVDEFSDAELSMIAKAEVPAEYDHLDALLD